MNRDELKKQLRRDEGSRLKPYIDSVGKMTIGVGHNLSDVGITEDVQELLLNNDIDDVEQALDNNYPWWHSMDEARQLVLANMCFNMGIHVLSGFKNTLDAMQRGDYQTAAAGMKSSKWAEQVGPRAERLILMMERGK